MAYIITTAWRMKARRKMLGFTLAQVAQLAGCTAGLLSHIEKERVETPRKSTQVAIANALNCDPDWLFGGDIHRAPAGFYTPAYDKPDQSK